MSLSVKPLLSSQNFGYQPVSYQPVRKMGFGCVECDSFVSTKKQDLNVAPQVTFGQRFAQAAQVISQFSAKNPAEIGKQLGNAIYGTNIK